MTTQDFHVQQCGIVILAAGQSSRLGSPKQLLPYQGTSLIEHTVNIALATGWQPVIVVLGANGSNVQKTLAEKPAVVVENEGWEEGMASSLRVGLQHMQEKWPGNDGVLFMVCDQPFVTPELLTALLSKQQVSGQPLIASSYGGKSGTPALFHKSVFPQLMELKGDTGARKLINENRDKVATVNFPEGAMDIDTRDDYNHLING